MICGLEINAPMTTMNMQSTKPSVAALASSSDKNGACYNMTATVSGDATYAR